jgi:tetratricopeptide (TPR) repeat protein
MDAQSWYKEGRAKAQKGDWLNARMDFDEAIVMDPEFIKAYLVRAYVRRKLNDNEGALKDYSAVIKLDPKHADAYDGRGQVYSRMGAMDQALADYTRAIQLGASDRATTHFNRATVHAKRGSLALAIDDYSEAIQHNPKFGDAYHSRALLYARSDESLRALADFEQALQHGTSDIVRTLLARAAVLEVRESWAAAVQDYQAVLKRDPQNAAGRKGLEALKARQAEG